MPTPINNANRPPKQSILCRVRIFALGSWNNDDKTVELDLESQQRDYATFDDDVVDDEQDEDISTVALTSTTYGEDDEADSTTHQCSSSSSTDSDNDEQDGIAAINAISTSTPSITAALEADDDSSTRALPILLGGLSDQELEDAASSSYQYCNYWQSRRRSNDTEEDGNGQQHQQMMMMYYAGKMTWRHLRAEKDDPVMALQKVRQTLQFRRDWTVDDTRQTFDDDGSNSLAHRRRQRRISSYLGKGLDGRLFVRGFDREGHACLHYIVRNAAASSGGQPLQQSINSKKSLECMLAFVYILEKSIACSEGHSDNTDGMITVSVDLKGFHKSHLPPLDALHQILILLRDHYPERLHRVYLMDAPFIFRYFWAAFKPGIDPQTREKFQFVSGRFQRNRLIRSGAFDLAQCMPYQHIHGKLVCPVNMSTFYKLPFDKASIDACLHA